MPQNVKAKSQSAAGRSGRLIALVVFAACVGAIGYIHRADLLPPEQQADAAANPEFIACRTERTGHVTKMLADGVINQAQHDQFIERAVSYCAAQFPPGGNEGPAQ